MEQRILGRTGVGVGVVGLGAWQLGADWGEVDPADATATLDAAVAAGMSLIDTADVYGDGRSEHFIGQFLRTPAGRGVFVATKMGRRMAQDPANYSMANFRAWS